MANFLKHESCPECRKVGKDQKGNNLARYDNGSGWCFSCKHWEPPTHWKPEVRKETTAVPSDLCSIFPKENLDWLKQYLTVGEIIENFKYSPILKRHVYSYGTYWEGRSVNPNVPKCLSHGEKPFYIKGSWEKLKKIVVVEDVVSAIAVSRVCGALPLFGSHLSGDWMAKLARCSDVDEFVIWLDHDKYEDAIKFSNKMKLLGVNCTVRQTHKDPKAHTTLEIKAILG